MTASLFNLPITSPVAGTPGASASPQGAAAGFEALLAAFFGAPGDGAATGLFGEAKTGKDEPAPADPSLAANPNADALALAAQLTAPPLPNATPVDTAPEAPAPASAPAPPVLPFPPVTADAKLAETAAKTEDATPQLALAAEDAAQPAVAKAAVGPEQKPAQDAPPTPAPARNAAPQAASAPPPPVQPTPQPPADPLAQAQAVASEAAVPVEPAKDRPVARNGKTAEPTRRGGVEAAEPAAPTVVSNTLTAPGAKAAAGDALASPEIEAAAAAPAREAKAETSDGPDAQLPAPAQAAQAAQTHAAAHAPVRGTSETVATLAAQIAKKLDGRSTRFDVQLNPIGLGQVNVAVEIAANGRMTAAMTFENPHAAAELRARSGELQRALEQAGFDLSGGMTFDVAGDHGGGRSAWADQQQQQAEGAWRGRAFQAVLGTAGDAADAANAAALNLQRRTRSGVDVRI